MGDEISMKKILILAVFAAGVYAAPDMSAYEDKFNALSQKRAGLSDKDILFTFVILVNISLIYKNTSSKICIKLSLSIAFSLIRPSFDSIE